MFIEGRSIIDNIMFFHKFMKWYTRKGLSPIFVIDLKKTYNSIKWGFLKYVLSKLGFPFKFIRWVMEFISTISYPINMYGDFTKPFE